VIDCHQAIVVPCFVDAHTHLIKTQTVPRNRNRSGTIQEALTVAEVADRPNWKTPDDVLRRIHFAAACAVHHGTRAIRTHLDGCEDPETRDAVYAAFDAIRDAYAQVLIVQGVANLLLPLWLTPKAKEHAGRAKQHPNVVLGAYVGVGVGANQQPDPQTVQAMEALFQYAKELDNMDCDLHIDESNDPKCCALLALVESLSKARQSGYTGRVVLGHCCSLALQSPERQDYICTQLANKLQPVYVVSNPFTNLGLQDRRGSQPPFGTAIPLEVPRTPQWRGLTLLQELRHAGVVVASASDNIRDYWYPYGDYDMLSVWAQVQAMGQLDTAPSEGAWADLVSVTPAKAMGFLAGGGGGGEEEEPLQVGQSADLIVFPSARRASELFARPQTDRLVLRRGKVQTTRLPEFSELDDLVGDV
jgi:cytosine deaminase